MKLIIRLQKTTKQGLPLQLKIQKANKLQAKYNLAYHFPQHEENGLPAGPPQTKNKQRAI